VTRLLYRLYHYRSLYFVGCVSSSICTDVECGVGPLSVMSLLLFVCVCNSIDVLKCLRKCLEFD
jgi:hypothetical protein